MYLSTIGHLSCHIILISLKCLSHQRNGQGSQDVGFIKIHKISLCLELVRMENMIPTKGSFSLTKLVLTAWVCAFTA